MKALKYAAAIGAMALSLVILPSPSVAQSGGAAPAVQNQNVFNLSPSAESQVRQDANQPQNNAPVWREVNKPIGHVSTITTPEANVLIQSSGNQWSLIRNGVISVFGGWLIVLATVGVFLVYKIKGEIKLKAGRSGNEVLRFTDIERWSHWAMAYSFVTLAISGMVIMWGRDVLLPIIGGTAFGALTFALKNIHNIVGPFFTVAVIVFFVLYVRDNIPNKGDLEWFKAGGHGPAHRFNGGEKLWFWAGVTFLGLIVSVSGWILDGIVPGVEYFTRGTMQIANIIHGIAATLFIVMAMGHIYIGSIGTEGAIDGMRTGYVDENWGKEHHSLWLEDVKRGADHRGRFEETAPRVSGAPSSASNS